MVWDGSVTLLGEVVGNVFDAAVEDAGGLRGTVLHLDLSAPGADNVESLGFGDAGSSLILNVD